MTQAALNVRPLYRPELDQLIEWAAREGWNPGLHDADAFFAADPGGYLGGFRRGELVAAVSAVKFGEHFGFMGFYIVRPDRRGLGYGLEVFEAGLQRLAGRVTGLDGVLRQQENYESVGFHLAHRNRRYAGRVRPGRPCSRRVEPAAGLPFHRVAEYDSLQARAPRSTFLGFWLTRPDTTALVIRGEAGRVVAFGVARPCRKGFKIGPLFADTAELASELLDGLLSHLPAWAPWYLDVPVPNAAAVALAEARDGEVVFETVRMYRGGDPALPLDRIFGITTFELG